MNIQVSRRNNSLLYWIAAIVLVMCCGLGDTAIVAWLASLATFGQLSAAAMAFLLIATGVLFTVWKIRR